MSLQQLLTSSLPCEGMAEHHPHQQEDHELEFAVLSKVPFQPYHHHEPPPHVFYHHQPPPMPPIITHHQPPPMPPIITHHQPLFISAPPPADSNNNNGEQWSPSPSPMMNRKRPLTSASYPSSSVITNGGGEKRLRKDSDSDVHEDEGEEESLSSSEKGTMSPICPHCDRFISHYKGNIRRHVNQCKKITTPASTSIESSTASRDGSTTSSSFVTEAGEVEQHQPQQQQHPPLQYPPPSYTNYDSFGEYEPNCGASIPPPMMIVDQHVGFPSSALAEGMMPLQPLVVPPMFDPAPHPQPLQPPPPTKSIYAKDDPYVCLWCEFNTVYKGNMKRHMISCHGMSDEVLRRHSFDVESLRKTAKCPARVDCLPIELVQKNKKKEKGRRRVKDKAVDGWQYVEPNNHLVMDL